jgi:pimeloyl-ACP methyl ester carboxylesterase
MAALESIRCPTLVIGTHDRFDAEHPLAVAREYEARIPGARFAIEDDGTAPLTWRGGALTKAIEAFLHS